MEPILQALRELNDRFTSFESTFHESLNELSKSRMIKDRYTTAEVAKLLSKAEWTVRDWCRLGRIFAEKKPAGRGASSEWLISHGELTRIRNEGLLPIKKPDRHVQ